MAIVKEIASGGWAVDVPGPQPDGRLGAPSQQRMVKVRYRDDETGAVVMERLIDPQTIGTPVASFEGGFLFWTPVGGAEGYQIQTSADGGQAWRDGDPATAKNPPSEQSLGPGTHAFRVRAVYEGVPGPWSEIVTATGATPAPPTDPDGED